VNQNVYKIVLNGDFNFPFIHWLEPQTSDEGGSYVIGNGLTGSEKSQSESFMHFVNSCLLTQIIYKPTRINNILDLCFINAVEYVKCVDIGDTQLSDHRLIEVTLDSEILEKGIVKRNGLGYGRNSSSLRKLNFHHPRINWDGINNEILGQDWNAIISGAKDVQEAKDNFDKIIFNYCIEHIPRKRNRKKNKFHKYRTTLMNRRRLIKRQTQNEACLHRLTQQNNHVLKIEREIQISHEQEKMENESKATEKIKQNSKFFFSYAAQFSVAKSKVGPLLDENDELFDDNQVMSEMLSRQYTKVFSTPRPEIGYRFENTDQEILDIEFTKQCIEDAIDELKVNSSSGPDEMPAIVLKKCKNSVSFPLMLLWSGRSTLTL